MNRLEEILLAKRDEIERLKVGRQGRRGGEDREEVRAGRRKRDLGFDGREVLSGKFGTSEKRSRCGVAAAFAKRFSMGPRPNRRSGGERGRCNSFNRRGGDSGPTGSSAQGH